ncbi:ribbon-helix-helix domain-containing protein [Haladaptatus sp. DFWS20]|uniref:ribbon-helix-helix domain-containing protein n=1 Tax=Haladaptatus sp. DFWS20 TaxID=3403467 RepID=UPI003EC0A34F
MVTFEVVLPDHTESEIDRLVDQGDFVNRDQAIEELLSLAISVHGMNDESEDEFEEELFSQMADEQQDPADQFDDSF